MGCPFKESRLEEVTCPFTWALPGAGDSVLKSRGLGGAQAGVAVRRNHKHPLLGRAISHEVARALNSGRFLYVEYEGVIYGLDPNILDYGDESEGDTDADM